MSAYENINLIVSFLRQYKIVALPTDSVYGLSGLIYPKVVKKIISLKQRNIKKGFIIISCNIKHLLYFVDLSKLNVLQIKKISTLYFQPITWIVPVKAKYLWLTGQSRNIAIRLTGHFLLSKITNILNQAIISTSANISGQPPAMNCDDLYRYFKSQISYVYPYQYIDSHKSSKIINVISGIVLRE